MNPIIRQPIVTVCGHVDHGKTSILDSLRGTFFQESECGGITQKISFTSYPMSQLKVACPLIETSGIKVNIPGFLFIDTPGHAAFTSLRKRGGSLSDLAILVIDINEGIKPQTAEVIKILKHHKTPFIIALNKIDNISGWRYSQKQDENIPLENSIESQENNVKQVFNERYMTLIGALSSHGYESDLYYNVKDFTKKVAIVPLSARTKQGIPELIMMLCGLSQKYLADKLTLGKDAKGVMLEVKKDKSNNYIEAILHDGILKKTDEIAIASFSPSGNNEPILSKIRILEEIQPLCDKFSPAETVQASTGIRMQLIDKSEILPGMPFEIFKNNKQELQEKFKKEISENIKTSNKGIIAKADSLGSLEALLVLLKQENIPVLKAGIGKISKTDIISAKANLEINELDGVIAGFNVFMDEEAKELLRSEKNIKVIEEEVIYKLIENLSAWRSEKIKEIEKKRLMGLTTICKLEILPQYVFRNTNPAIFGVRVLGGKIRKNLTLIDEQGNKIARIKNLELDRKSVDEAKEGSELAISLPGINFERVLGKKTHLYTDISEKQFREFKKNKDLLTQGEIKTLQEIAEIKRSQSGKDDWGR
jgi:translation initiation factor 5B